MKFGEDPGKTLKPILVAVGASIISGVAAIAGRAVWKAWRAAGKTELELAVEAEEKAAKEDAQAEVELKAAMATTDPKDDVLAREHKAQAKALKEKAEKRLSLVRRLKAIGDAVADVADSTPAKTEE